MDGMLAGAAGLVGLYVALRTEIRRSYEILGQKIDHLGQRADHSDSRANRLEEHSDSRANRLEEKVDGGFAVLRTDIRRLDQKIDAVRGELITFLGPRQA